MTRQHLPTDSDTYAPTYARTRFAVAWVLEPLERALADVATAPEAEPRSPSRTLTSIRATRLTRSRAPPTPELSLRCYRSAG
jgi:hypothetical protein